MFAFRITTANDLALTEGEKRGDYRPPLVQVQVEVHLGTQIKLWLDDVRPPWMWGRVGWEWAKSGETAIELLKTGRVTEASLDHDLAWEHYPQNGLPESAKSKAMTGYDVCCWLERNPQYLPPDGITVHSMNPVGRERMKQVLDRLYSERRDFMQFTA